MKYIIILFTALFCTSAGAADFSFSFDWSGLNKCTSGQPNRVGNPSFKLKNVPAGTQYVYFKLKDLNVRSYNHGGGWVKMSKDGTVAKNAFKYKSPCPPNGVHVYEWTATAHPKKSKSKTIAKAKAKRSYPE
ncbi:MAG: hypothetical protein ACPGVK_04730 [Halocynthiibacter sp.]